MSLSKTYFFQNRDRNHINYLGLEWFLHSTIPSNRTFEMRNIKLPSFHTTLSFHWKVYYSGRTLYLRAWKSWLSISSWIVYVTKDLKTQRLEVSTVETNQYRFQYFLSSPSRLLLLDQKLSVDKVWFQSLNNSNGIRKNCFTWFRVNRGLRQSNWSSPSNRRRPRCEGCSSREIRRREPDSVGLIKLRTIILRNQINSKSS